MLFNSSSAVSAFPQAFTQSSITVASFTATRPSDTLISRNGTECGFTTGFTATNSAARPSDALVLRNGGDSASSSGGSIMDNGGFGR